jgi:anti-sigma regulatory factor (Ser/Thr protein kinase)
MTSAVEVAEGHAFADRAIRFLTGESSSRSHIHGTARAGVKGSSMRRWPGRERAGRGLVVPERRGQICWSAPHVGPEAVMVAAVLLARRPTERCVIRRIVDLDAASGAGVLPSAFPCLGVPGWAAVRSGLFRPRGRYAPRLKRQAKPSRGQGRSRQVRGPPSPRICVLLVRAGARWLADGRVGQETCSQLGVMMSNPPQTVLTVFAARPRAAHDARVVTARALSAWKLSHLTETATLLVSELVTNAIAHAGEVVAPGKDVTGLAGSVAPVILGLSFWESLLVQVWDHSHVPPLRRVVADDAEGGRGLELVDALSKEWGYEVMVTGGKIVWFSLEAGCG